jgi:hypothetical protein
MRPKTRVLARHTQEEWANGLNQRRASSTNQLLNSIISLYAYNDAAIGEG